MADERTRFRELLRYPRETLDVELKDWLDLRDDSARADLAQAILAMANHGGGIVILGFKEHNGLYGVGVPGPADVTAYNQDVINNIVKRYADPPFHCDFHLITPEDATVAHPVIVVPGGHRVPVRARSGGPDGKHVKEHNYYIRRPGPESSTPRTSQEWDALIRRCLQASKDELVDLIRGAVLGLSTATGTPAATAHFDDWLGSTTSRFDALVKQDLQAEVPHRYAMGYWTLSYAVMDAAEMSLQKLKDSLAAAQGHETGWPVWMVFTKNSLAPYAYDGSVECWVHESNDTRDGSLSDFWRASPQGELFLLRGYQEDVHQGRIKPGTVIDRRIHIWRIGECLLHAQRFASIIGCPSSKVVVRAQWVGLKGRRLGEVLGDWPMGADSPEARQSSVQSQASMDADQIRTNLGTFVQQLIEPLYNLFGFESVRADIVDEELRKMMGRRRG